MATFEDTPDYGPVAAWHDSTRNIPADLLSENYKRISALTGFGSTWRVLDVCCGSGQLTMPLLASGYEVVGIDVSSEMLDLANTKLEAGWRGAFIYGDACNMEFTSNSFDAAVISRHFLHVGNMLQVINEIQRVVRPEGLVMVIEGKGSFSHTVLSMFRAECERRGHARRSQDDQDRATIADQFAHLGATQLNFDASDLKWTKALTYGECLEHLRLRFHSEFWLIPDAEYDDILRQIQEELVALPDGLSTKDTLTPVLQTTLFVTPARP